MALVGQVPLMHAPLPKSYILYKRLIFTIGTYKAYIDFCTHLEPHMNATMYYSAYTHPLFLSASGRIDARSE